MSRATGPIESPCRVVRFSIDYDGDQNKREKPEKRARKNLSRSDVQTNANWALTAKTNKAPGQRTSAAGRGSTGQRGTSATLFNKFNYNIRGYSLIHFRIEHRPCDLSAVTSEIQLALFQHGQNHHQRRFVCLSLLLLFY